MTVAANRALTALLFLYVAALHTSMAAMEIIVWLLCVYQIVVFVRARKVPPFPDWMPILGLTLCVAISVLLNPGGRSLGFQLGFMRWAIILYLLPWVLSRVWSEEFERRLVAVWAGVALITGLYALFQTFTGIDLIRPTAGWISNSGGIYRPVGFFSRSLAFAYSFGLSFMMLTLPVRKYLPKWFVWPFLTVGVCTLIATEARGVWIGLVAAIAFWLGANRPRYLLGFAVIVAIIVGVLASTDTYIGIKLQYMLAMKLEHSSAMRTHLWAAYWQMWKEHPFFGVGLLQGDLIVPQYYRQLGINEEFVSNAHNTYLQWLAGAGVFALGFFLWLCFRFLKRAWDLRHKSPWGWSILMAQILLFTGAMTENNFFTAITNHMLIFGWSILISIRAAQTRDETARSDRRQP